MSEQEKAFPGPQVFDEEKFKAWIKTMPDWRRIDHCNFRTCAMGEYYEHLTGYPHTNQAGAVDDNITLEDMFGEVGGEVDSEFMWRFGVGAGVNSSSSELFETYGEAQDFLEEEES